MKIHLVKALCVGALGTLLGSGCAMHHRPVVVTPEGEVVVSSPPPAPRHEVAGMAPGGSYQWVAGYWTYHDTRWVWIPGHWQHPPRTDTHWIPGHWDYTERGWVWTPGHWENVG